MKVFFVVCFSRVNKITNTFFLTSFLYLYECVIQIVREYFNPFIWEFCCEKNKTFLEKVLYNANVSYFLVAITFVSFQVVFLLIFHRSACFNQKTRFLGFTRASEKYVKTSLICFFLPQGKIAITFFGQNFFVIMGCKTTLHIFLLFLKDFNHTEDEEIIR